MKALILWLLRKHWKPATEKVNTVRFLTIDGRQLVSKFPMRQVTVHRDFADLYFFPSIAAKLVKPSSLEVIIEVGAQGEKMFFPQ